MKQGLHPDFETTLAETEYFVLGSGRIQVGIQWCRSGAGTRLGVAISDPEQFCRKWSTHVFHPEYGLERTRIGVVNGGGVQFAGDDTAVRWLPDSASVVEARWCAGSLKVVERFWCSPDEPVLVREVVVEDSCELVELEVSLYANPAIFSKFGGDASHLDASGYATLRVWSSVAGVFDERRLHIAVPIRDGVGRVELRYELGAERCAITTEELWRREVAYWNDAIGRASVDVRDARLRRLWLSSAAGLRAAVSNSSGRFDASLWQYGFEWTGDASKVAEALIASGQYARARLVLENILARLTNADGMAMESGRFRGGVQSELNNNGEILHACGRYLERVGDVEFLRAHYGRIRAIAEYLLRPEFCDAATGMLVAMRDIWERSGAAGLKLGYDISHQTFGVLGLRAASSIARQLGCDSDATRWASAAQRLEDAMFHHPTCAMVEDGVIIARRLVDGRVQRSLELPDASGSFASSFVPVGMPLRAAGSRQKEPDIASVFPIVHGLIAADHAVARATVKAMRELWNQAWDGGGCGRYHVESEPDSPGPWPLATLYLMMAARKVGDDAMQSLAMEWVLEKAGVGGAMFEFYGERATPPLPPTGILVWNWAAWIQFVELLNFSN